MHIRSLGRNKNLVSRQNINNYHVEKWKKEHPEISFQVLVIILLYLKFFTNIDIPRQCKRNSPSLLDFLSRYWDILFPLLSFLVIYEIGTNDSSGDSNSEELKIIFTEAKNLYDQSQEKEDFRLFSEANSVLVNGLKSYGKTCVQVALTKDSGGSIIPMPILKKSNENNQYGYTMLKDKDLETWANVFITKSPIIKSPLPPIKNLLMKIEERINCRNNIFGEPI